MKTKTETNKEREIRWAREDRQIVRDRLEKEQLPLEVRKNLLNRLAELNTFLTGNPPKAGCFNDDIME